MAQPLNETHHMIMFGRVSFHNSHTPEPALLFKPLRFFRIPPLTHHHQLLGEIRDFGTMHRVHTYYRTGELAEHHLQRERFVACKVSQNGDRKSTRLNSSHVAISYAVF